MGDKNKKDNKMKNESGKESKGNELVITRIFDASIERVWKAWTEPKEMMKWWGPAHFTTPFVKTDLRLGGKYLCCMKSPEGKEFWSTGIYKEIEPLKKLVCTDSFADEKGNVVSAKHYNMSGDFPMELQVTTLFEDLTGKTKMTFKHLGIPAGQMKEMTAQGWNEMFDKLQASLIMGNKETFSLSRVFNASREKVWDALTKVEHLKHWWGPAGFSWIQCELDLRPGGIFHYCMTSPDGHPMWGKFVYRSITKPESMEYVVSFSNKDGGITRHPMSNNWPQEVLSLTILAEHEGKTTLKIYSMPINASEVERKTFVAGHSSMQGGFKGTFDQLEEYLKQDEK